jgi:hypothetical protein
MTAISTFGTTVKVGTATSGAYTAPAALVGELTSVSLDGLKLNAIDVSTLSTRHRTFVPGMIDSGSISMEVNLDTNDAQHLSIIGQLDTSASSTAPVLKSWLITFGVASTNPGCTVSFVGLVTDFSAKAGLDSALTASMTVKISGAVTVTDIN